jgi:hypothetical protein
MLQGRQSQHPPGSFPSARAVDNAGLEAARRCAEEVKALLAAGDAAFSDEVPRLPSDSEVRGAHSLGKDKETSSAVVRTSVGADAEKTKKRSGRSRRYAQDEDELAGMEEVEEVECRETKRLAKQLAEVGKSEDVAVMFLVAVVSVSCGVVCSDWTRWPGLGSTQGRRRQQRVR